MPLWLAHLRRLVAAAVLLGTCLAPARAEDWPLRASWLRTAPDQTAEQVLRNLPHEPFQAFEPTRLTAFVRQPHGVWILLESPSGVWPQTPAMLSVPAPPMGAATLYRSDGEAPQRTALDDMAAAMHGHGRLAFPLIKPLAPHARLLLWFEPYPSIFGPVTFALQPLQDYYAADSAWLVFASVCFTSMAAMSVMAVLFAARLGDATFLYYAAYVSSFSLLLAIQSGYAFHPLELGLIARAPLVWGRAATGLSVMLATLFLARFASLRRYTPRARWLVLAVGWMLAAVTLLGLLPVPAVQALSRALINPALMAGALVLLLASLYAWWRGSRYAGFFLAGWTPLLVATALGSAQTSGALADWIWLNDAQLAAGAFESLLLSLGLADRTLAVRRERDRARTLAETDPLTGLLNRRAWTSRLADLIEAAAGPARPLAVMFVDLDHFKSLNDCFGHDAGDTALSRVARALHEELRPADLLGRYGGEEFVAALPGLSPQRAAEVAERLRAGIEALGVPVNPGGAVLTASVGVAILAPGEGVKALTARADQAMYQAKNAGRNRVVVAGV